MSSRVCRLVNQRPWYAQPCLCDWVTSHITPSSGWVSGSIKAIPSLTLKVTFWAQTRPLKRVEYLLTLNRTDPMARCGLITVVQLITFNTNDLIICQPHRQVFYIVVHAFPLA